MTSFVRLDPTESLDRIQTYSHDSFRIAICEPKCIHTAYFYPLLCHHSFEFL